MKEVLSYLLAVGGLGVMMYVFGQVAGRRKYAEARAFAIHMLRTQPNRAEMVFRASKGTCLEALAMAIKTAAQVKSRDPKIINMATIPGYDASCGTIRMHWKGVLKLAKVGAGLSFGAVAMALAVHAMPVIHIILGVASGVMALLVFLFKLDVDRSLMFARAEILPEVDMAIANGSYQLPP